jgi:hypothetical protein
LPLLLNHSHSALWERKKGSSSFLKPKKHHISWAYTLDAMRQGTSLHLFLQFPPRKKDIQLFLNRVEPHLGMLLIS